MINGNAILEVDVAKIIHNIELIRKEKEVCIPVKGNAYGIGLGIIDVFMDKGYNFFSVSNIDEAIYIKKKKKEAKVLILSAIFPEDLELIEKYDILFTIYDFDLLEKVNKNHKFHIKIDLGMGRLGFQVHELDKVKNILQEKKLTINGLYTHLPKIDNELESNIQIKIFQKITKEFKKIFSIEYIHIFNGLGSLKYDTNFDNLIRPGLAIYGYYGSKDIYENNIYKLEESLELKLRINHIKKYSGTLGYDLLDKVDGEVITFGLGYHDGFITDFQGYKIQDVGRIVGKICMCQFMLLVDKKKEGNFRKGKYIELFGENRSIYNLSEYSNKSIYEILSVLSTRIIRKYKNY